MSVIAQEPNFRALAADPHSNLIIRGVLNECLNIAKRQNCSFPKNYVDDIINNMIAPYPPTDDNEPLDQSLLTTMYQDLLANRPLEFEVYLGNPVRMAAELGVSAPNLQALYAIGRHINKARTKPDGARSPQIPPPRQVAAPIPPRQSMPPVNGRGRGAGPRSFSDGPPVANGRGRPITNGYRQPQRRGSFEGDLDQFRDIVTYGDSIGEDIPPPNFPNGSAESDPYLQPPPSRSRLPPRQSNASDFDLRQRELLLREREIQIRERELEIQRRQGRARHNIPSTIMDDEEDEDDTRPTNMSQRQLMMGGDNFDMMSVTGRKARKPGAVPVRGKPAFNDGGGGGRLMSLGGGRNKGRSPSMMSTSQATFDPLNENPLMGFTSNRYPGVDTRTLTANSRANSLTSQRMDEIAMGPGAGRTASMMGGGGGAYPMMSRGPPPGRNGPMPGPSRGRPPQPQHISEYGGPPRGYQEPPGLAPGPPPKDSKVRSTTGSASASSASLGGNGESHSSSSSLEPPLHHGRF